MADELPNYAMRQLGSAKTWKNTGGDKVITLTSLAAGTTRQGEKIDFGSTWDNEHLVCLKLHMASAPTNGEEVRLDWGPSDDVDAGDENPGGLTGTDGSLTNASEKLGQLDPIGVMPLSNNLGTAVQMKYFTFKPRSQYGSPVVTNGSAVNFGSTAGNFEIRMRPLISLVQDTHS